MTDEPGAGTVWRAALEQLPPDSLGFRRTLRLHAVAFQDSRPAPQALCGYQHQEGELRPDRDWETVTASGRCTLCDMRLRRTMGTGVEVTESLDLTKRDAPEFDAPEFDGPESRPRLSVVIDEKDRTPAAERRSPDRP